MRTSQFPLNTVKEVPSDAEIISHQLMIRAGLIRKIAAGVYTWLPLGLRVLRKVERIVHQEMQRAGALEVLMPALQPAELWQESGRWDKYGPELMRLKDRHQRDFCMGPTHEEIITELARGELKSYRQLPVCYYQIQTKFRDEIRPRFGVMRAREFVMKDAYSFHADQASLQHTYDTMYQAYSRIFARLGLNFRAVLADTGAIGGSHSHEFHVLAETGEDGIAFSTESDYAANVELAEALAPAFEAPAARQMLELVDTPNQHSIAEVAGFLGTAPEHCLKTLIQRDAEGRLYAFLLRGDHEFNPSKAEKLEGVAGPLYPATEGEILAACGARPGSLGPIGLKLPMWVDRSAAVLADFVCGANQNGRHYRGVNWQRDLPLPAVADLRQVVNGDPSPDGVGTLTIARGIEVGHIFQLGTRYSEAMNAVVTEESGGYRPLLMGCYGIGVTRVVGAAIEQNHDEHGILWPDAMAPFHIALCPVNLHRSERLRAAVETLYAQLTETGCQVLLDDRNVRTGFMFADMELIGIPHRVVLSDKHLDAGTVEYRSRRDGANIELPQSELLGFLKTRVRV